MTVERPASYLGCAATGCFFHVNLEPKKRVFVRIDHSQIRPGGRQAFKAGHWSVRGGIEDLPFEDRTR